MAINYDNISIKLGNWAKKFKPLFDKGDMDNVYVYLKNIDKTKHTVIPQSINLYRAFKECDINNVSLVIIGDCPYNKIIDGIPIDSGVWLDSSAGAITQQKQKNFYAGIEKELYDGICLDYIQEWDMSYLLKQGVLLIPCSLTCTESETHYELWKPFIEFFLIEIIKYTGIPVIFVGKEACKYSWIINDANPVFEMKDIPETIGQHWDTEGKLSKILSEIKNNNGEILMLLQTEVPF